MALPLNNVGSGIALQAKPEDYAQIYERGLAHAFNQQAKKAAQDDDDWKKYMGLLKPKGDLHPLLIERNNENYARALNDIHNIRLTQPNSWRMAVEKRVYEPDAKHDLLKGVTQTLNDFQAAPDEKKDPFQRYMTQVLRTSKTMEDAVKAYQEDPRSKSPDSGVVMNTDPNSPLYGTISMNGYNPNKNLTSEARTLLSQETLMDETVPIRVKGANNSYVDKVTKRISDKKARELLGLEFDKNADTQQQYKIDNRYSNPEKIATYQAARENYINDMMPLRGRKTDVSIENVPQSTEAKKPSSGFTTPDGKTNFFITDTPEITNKETLSDISGKLGISEDKINRYLLNSKSKKMIWFSRTDLPENRFFNMRNNDGVTGSARPLGFKESHNGGWNIVVSKESKDDDGNVELKIDEFPYDDFNKRIINEFSGLTPEIALQIGGADVTTKLSPSEWSNKWSALKKGESMVGLDGKTYTKK